MLRAPFASLAVALYLHGSCLAADWPLSRFNAQRTAASPQELPEKLQLLWTRELPALRPAWPDQPKLQTDVAYDPVVVGKRMFVGSSRYDRVMAYDTESGEELWQFQIDGPARFAPAVWEDKVYVACDDGLLYCLDAPTGKLKWSFRGGPHDRRVLGNDRLISLWPARGAPVLADGKVYFAAGVWPFMGVFLHALDARTGKVVWTNDGDGAMYIKQPHNADAFAGIAPQGEMVVAGNKLLIPGGRSIPAIYDLQTGKMSAYLLAENGKRGGGCEVAATEKYMINGGDAFDLKSAKYAGAFADFPVLMKETWFGVRGNKYVVALDGANAGVKTIETVDAKGAKSTSSKFELKELTSIALPGVTAMIGAGGRVYAAQEGKITALNYDGEKTEFATGWSAEVPGSVAVMLTADDKLFAVTREGTINCFGGATTRKFAEFKITPAATPTGDWESKAQKILTATKVKAGYCVAYGIGSGDLVIALAKQSQLSIIVLDPDQDKVRRFRDRLQGARIDRYRIAVHAANPLEFPLPPYLASLIVSEDLASAKLELNAEFIDDIYHSLRPFGGVACLPLDAGKEAQLEQLVEDRNLPGAKLREEGAWTLLSREGALPDTANWTHEHADAANTRVSADKVVKAPLGILWFGGSSHDGVLPRHGHGPQPQVLDGRVIIEGSDMLRAMDIYTGRTLWQVHLPGLGSFYNNTAHQPGANASGTNFISTTDGVYVAYGLKGLRLDPDTGTILSEFTLPNFKGMEGHSNWGYLNVVDDYLIAGADPMYDPLQFKVAPENYTDPDPATTPKEAVDKANASVAGKKDDKADAKTVKKIDSDNLSSSRHLVVLDRHSGKVLWSISSQDGFRHNGTCAGGGRLYTIDRISGPELAKLKRRGEEPPHKPRLLVHDLKSGKLLWSTDEDVFGTWLSYSAARDTLVEAGRVARDTISDEPKGMRVYKAANGEVVWKNMTYAGPAMIHHDWILMAGTTTGNACELLTGKLRQRPDPLTGVTVDWSWLRTYGCNTPMASENLLTFRSGAAGYFDLCHDGGTGNLGGFRSSCSNNLVVAGGVLVAPDYTRTCTCNYQIQTSVGFVHMPEAEMWTFTATGDPKAPIRRLGINFGAAGDRKAENGTLWLEYPSTGGKSAAVPITVNTNGLQWFRQHSSTVTGEGPTWVAASGGKGLTSVKVTLAKQAKIPRKYTVRLHFMEPENVRPGDRVFDITLQGEVRMEGLDIVREAGAKLCGLVKEFQGVSVLDDLQVTLKPVGEKSSRPPVLSGLEIIVEEGAAE